MRSLKAAQKVVYGVDDREEAFQITDADVRRNADAVVSLIRSRDLTDNGDGTFTISTSRFGTEFNLCDQERFANQPVSAFCSGFLVAPDIVVTAGHCVNNNTLASVRFVFGFRLRADGSVVTTVPSGNVFRGAGLIDHALNGPSRSDFAVVRLDRPAVGHPIVRVRRSLKIANQQAVYVIGHPSGLPLKHADGANVRDNDPGAFFSANLDTYGGNSGSPVFNSETNLVEGILVRGDTDFVTENGCRVSNVCPINGCGGEDVTRTSEFVKHVPDAPIDEHLDLDERVTRLEESVEEVLAIVKRLEDE